MASLNTLRTKFSIVLSIVIALALLAFIFSLKAEMGFSGNDPEIGVIDGTSISYTEYARNYELVKNQNGASENTEAQAAALANATWQSLIAKYVLTPSFEDLGLRFTEAERVAMMSGEIESSTFYNAFASPATGQYDIDAVTQFLADAEVNPQSAALWQQLQEQARLEREFQKYMGLVKGGVYVNALEVAQGVKSANNTYSGKWVSKKYSSMPDSLFKITEGDLKHYYNKNKESFKKLPTRSISYVVFDVEPTEEDLLAIESAAREMGAKFAEQPVSDISRFIRTERKGEVATTFVSVGQIPAEEAEILTDGEMYGPVLKNNEWTMSRVVATKTAPDTLGIRHIVLPFGSDNLADSLLTAIKGGASFAEVAAAHSINTANAANGGEVGQVPFSALSGEFANVLSKAKKGSVVKVAEGGALQIIEVYSTTKPKKHLQIATINYPLVASEATRNTVHSAAGTFTVKAKGGSVELFNKVAGEEALTPRVATITEGDRTVRGVENSREMTRWAYGAEVGELSEIFKMGDSYTVAIVTDINDDEYSSLKSVESQVRSQVLRDKRYEAIVAELSGTTLSEKAASLNGEVADFKDVTFGSFYIDGIGVEPRLIGAISVADKGVVYGPVKGMSGVYIFEVDNIAVAENQTTEGEKVRAKATAERMVQQFVMPAVQQMAEIEDLRGQYF